MEIIVEDAREPVWADENKTMIDLVVKFADMKVEVPFTASPTDNEIHGRYLFNKAKNGDFGEVAEFKSRNTAAYKPAKAIHDPKLQSIIDLANQEVASASTRAIVLIWAACIEDALYELLTNYLVKDKVSEDLLMKADGPLHSFMSRVKISFSLGLISKSEMNMCKNIATIRNYFAHNWNIAETFEDIKEGSKQSNLEKKFKAIYNASHSELFHWQDNIDYCVHRFYSSSCGALLLHLRGRALGDDIKRRELRQY